MAKTRVRVDLPSNPDDKIMLAKAIVGKHAELGAASPLGQLQWDRITPALAEADMYNLNSRRSQAQGEASTQARDAALEIVTTFLLRGGRDLLSGVYPDEMRKLGEFGFTVSAVSSRSAKAPPAAAAKPAT